MLVWQRNYYERVLRNDDELGRRRRYIADTPLQWERWMPKARQRTRRGANHRALVEEGVEKEGSS